VNNPSTARAQSPAANPFEINRRILGSDLPPAAKNILLVIVDHARHGASVCTASTRTIARESGVTEQYVSRVLRGLASRRLIAIDRRTGSKHSRHVITLGPCIHQVETPFQLRLHAVETPSPEVETPSLHEVETPFQQRTPLKGDMKDGDSSSTEEEIDPWTVRWFGVPPA
jgi:hypothetical protein